MGTVDKILVIPGAAAQIPLIKSIKKHGYQVVCINPFEDSPAFKYADFCERYDIMDVDNCIKIAEKYNVRAVMSDECDIAMPSVAAISEALNLPSIGSNLASLYTNKRMMRDFSIKKGFPCPLYKQCRSLDEAREFFKTLKSHKMIIKPLDSNSSRGVYTITDENQLDDCFDSALSYSRSSNVVLCEEYIEGMEFTVDGIVLDGKHHCLAVSKKKHYSHHPNIACELYFSYDDKDFDYDRLRRQNDNFVNESGLPFGFTHAEYKFNGKDFVLIEIGARGGGNYISSHIVPIMTDLNNYDILINETLKHKKDYNIKIDDKLKKRCSILKFFDIPKEHNGKSIKELKGEEYLRNNPNVLLYNFNFKIGDKLYIAGDDSKRVGFYIAYADTREQLDSLIQEIEENVKFIF